MSDKVLPSRQTPKGRLESVLDGFILRSLAQPSWPKAILRWGLRSLARLTLHFGRTKPYVQRGWCAVLLVFAIIITLFTGNELRAILSLVLLGLVVWYWVGQAVMRQLRTVRLQTARTVFLRRLFTPQLSLIGGFNTATAIVNWLAVLVGLWILPTVMSDAVEAVYAYGTYPFGTYSNVVVTQAYRNITNQTTFAIHGQQVMPNGEVKEIYLTLGPNVWFWDLFPEFIFGQIPVNGRCTFYTYGWTIRVPKRLSMAENSLYVLNPWIVGIKGGHCTLPTNVAPPSNGN